MKYHYAASASDLHDIHTRHVHRITRGHIICDGRDIEVMLFDGITL